MLTHLKWSKQKVPHTEHCHGNYGTFLSTEVHGMKKRSSAVLRQVTHLAAFHVYIVSVLSALDANTCLYIHLLPVQSNENHLCLRMLDDAFKSLLCGWTGV